MLRKNHKESQSEKTSKNEVKFRFHFDNNDDCYILYK